MYKRQDSPDQLTSDHGWEIKVTEHNAIRNIVEEIQTAKTRVSFFVDPNLSQINSINEVGAERIELYTGPYASDPSPKVLSQYEKAYHYAKDIGLGVNAGHDLDLNNLELFLSKVPADEVSIGHAFISDALIKGLDIVAKQYLDLCK